MRRRIILLTNTCPFGGEIFLQNELKWIPYDQSVNLYPIFAADRAVQVVQLNSNIDVQRFDSVWSVKERLNAGWNSLKMLFKTKEYAAALNKAKSLRNLIKAFKFAYISELRFSRILRQQRADGGKENEYIFYSYWLYEAAYIAARLKNHSHQVVLYPDVMALICMRLDIPMAICHFAISLWRVLTQYSRFLKMEGSTSARSIMESGMEKFARCG